MTLKTELITGIRILFELNRSTAVQFSSLGRWWAAEPTYECRLSKLIELHIRSCEGLKSLLCDLGVVSESKAGLGSRKPLRRPGPHLYISDGIRPPQSPGGAYPWYGKLRGTYHKVLDLRPMPPRVETTLLRQVSAVDALLCGLVPAGLNPRNLQVPKDRECS